MSNNIEKEAVDAFVKSGDIGKILIFSLIAMIIVISALVWIMQYNNTKQLAEFQSQGKAVSEISSSIGLMLSQTASVNDLRKEVFLSYKQADKNFAKVTAVLGAILEEHGVPFPQDLNIVITEFRSSFREINEKLVIIQD